jgi:hypothetical protein
MTLYLETAGGFVAWQGEPIPTPLIRWLEPVEMEVDGELVQVRKPEAYADDVSHPLTIEQHWTDEELAAVNLYRPKEAAPTPPYHRIVSASVARIDGVVWHVYELEEISVAARKADMQSALALRRWQAETGGINYGTIRVPTDDKTQSRVDQIVRAYADGDLSGAVSFKFPFGFVSLGEEELRVIKKLGAEHIQACFQKEADFSALIDAAQSHTDLDAIDFAHGWPSEE